jgi:chemotaxis family two-component system response regulator Rcp1
MKPATILMIDDSPGDVRLTEEALRELRIANQLIVLEDGAQAVSYLLRRGEHSNAVRPDLILLDWNLPKVDGSEVLEIIRTNENLCSIPVVILTGSTDQVDVVKAYYLQANCYITKPIDIGGLMTILQSCENLSFTISIAAAGDRTQRIPVNSQL